jgi:8-oxo-dGTP pyrophosphatase MutT (NUDIX family)
MSDLVSELLKLAEKKTKPSGTATKSNPAKWEAAKRKAKAKMGGKHSARAMQLATKYYKEDGGGYKGKKPSASNNKLKKWTKQDWQWSGERKKKSSVADSIVEKLAGKGVYLPAKSIDALKSTKKGRKKLRAASRKKTEATNKGEQVARHGLHEGKKRSKLGASDPNYRDRVALWLHDGKGNLLVQDDRDRGLGLKFPGGGIDEGQSVNDAAMREALEEVGYSLADKPRAIPGVRAKKIDWDPVFSAEAAAKGRNYKGSKHYHRLALAGDPDESLLGSEGDALAANWMPIAEVLEATRSAAANPDNKYNYFDAERLRAAEKVMEMLSNKTASYRSPYWQAYLIGQKLATADFGDNGSSDDMTLSFDSDVTQIVDPRDFASPEPHGNMTPSTNERGWIGVTDEVNPDKTEATNYKRDYLERT